MEAVDANLLSLEGYSTLLLIFTEAMPLSDPFPREKAAFEADATHRM
jgi:hypothetical protein